MTKVLCGTLAVLELAAACSRGRRADLPMPAIGATCYDVTYAPPRGIMFPALLVLNPGLDSAAAFWPATPADSVGVWRMFYLGAWRRSLGDSATVSFSNGFTAVELRVRRTADLRLDGAATWYSDVIDTLPKPRSELVGAGRACMGEASRLKIKFEVQQ